VNADPRLASIRLRLVDSEPDALYVTSIHNVVYLTGFDGVFDDGASAVCVITGERALVYTDSRYAEAATLAAAGTAWSVVITSDPLETRACADFVADGGGLLGFENSLAFARYESLSKGCGSQPVPTEQWVEESREVKEAAELERIGQAAALTDRTFDHILGVLAPGMSEAEVAVELESFMRRNGSEGVAFPSIVASGTNSSRPHATVTDRRIEGGDPVTLDFGARVGGYCADMTRTVVVGRATDDFRRVYDAVLAANEAGRSAVRAGMPGMEIDRVARTSLDDAGFGEHFGHGLGHGVGLQVHELPSVGPRGKREVPTGSVITIEPGVYLEGRFGARIEDLVTVEDEGCSVLTTSARDLIEV
jgi:Xaa-Pro aminopeptidase